MTTAVSLSSFYPLLLPTFSFFNIHTLYATRIIFIASKDLKRKTASQEQKEPKRTRIDVFIRALRRKTESFVWAPDSRVKTGKGLSFQDPIHRKPLFFVPAPALLEPSEQKVALRKIYHCYVLINIAIVYFFVWSCVDYS